MQLVKLHKYNNKKSLKNRKGRTGQGFCMSVRIC